MPDAGAIDLGEHRLTIRVYYEDTDAAGIVYHANHLRFAERARTEMMRSTGFDHVGLRERFGLTFTVRRCVIDFLAPAYLDDVLEMRTRSVRIGGASLDLEQRILRGDQLLALLEVRLALISSAGRPARLPRELIQGLPAVPGDPACRPVRA